MKIMSFVKSLFYATTLPPGGYKMVLVVRTDIPMGRGKIAAQCAHAAVECYRLARSNDLNKKMFEAWLHVGQPKIVLKVSSQQELLNLAEQSKRAGIVTAIIKDAGRTQVQSGTVTAMGIGPAPVGQIDQITSSLKLL